MAGYRRHLYEQELTKRTADVYVRLMVRAEAWMEPHGYDPATAPAELVQEWVEAEVPWSTSSRRQARSALGHYWAWRGRPDRPTWAVRCPKADEGVCLALEEDEASVLYRAARARGDVRGLAVLVGLHTALRREEIAHLRWSDFDLDGGWVKIIGKRARPAQLPVHPVVLAALAALPRADETWVFPGRFGGPVNPTTVWTWARAVAAEAGLGRVPTHRLRHTALATANDRTGDLRATQDFARHVKPETTARYTRVKKRRLEAVMWAIDYEAAAAAARFDDTDGGTK